MSALRLSVSTFLRRFLHKDSKARVRDMRVHLSSEGTLETAARQTARLSQWRRIVVIGAAALLTGALIAMTATDTPILWLIVNAAVAEGPNDFFNELAARADVYKGDFNIGNAQSYTDIPMVFSMRPDPAQLRLPSNDGVAASRWYRQLNRRTPLPKGGFLFTQQAVSRDAVMGQQTDFAKYHYLCWDNRSGTACTDTNPNRQDAVKVTVPPFDPLPMTTLASSVDRTQSTIVIKSPTGTPTALGNRLRALKICNEIVVVKVGTTLTPPTTTLPVNRGQFGTTPASCAAGSSVYQGMSNGKSFIQLPIKTGSDTRHTYLYTFDIRYTESFMGLTIKTHKMLYMHSSGISGGWIIPESNYEYQRNDYFDLANFDKTQHVGVFAFRMSQSFCTVTKCPNGNSTWAGLPPSGNSGWAGDNVTIASQSFPGPVVDNIPIRPNVWMRVFIKVVQRVNDFDLVSIWINDETTHTVQVWNALKWCLADGVKCGAGKQIVIDDPNNLDDAQWQFNTSANELSRAPTCNLATYTIGDLDDDHCNLTWYLRNFAVLEDPSDGDIATIIQRRPIPSGAAN